MAARDIIVIGASAGGIDALRKLAAELPSDLPAAVFVTLHLPAHTPSILPQILTRAGPLSAKYAAEGVPVAPSSIYVAPANRHLMFSDHAIHLGNGPRENMQRPCINVMFRSAAAVYGERVIGVLLTGLLDDGAAGLWEIQQKGGVTIAQNPDEAEYPSMPESAIRGFCVDHVAELREIGPLLNALSRQPMGTGTINNPETTTMEPTQQACPECGGSMQKAALSDGLEEYRCHVGHRIGLNTMIASKQERVTQSMWTALSQLEELIDLMQTKAAKGGNGAHAQMQHEIERRQNLARSLREILKHDG